jgi:hypothetical protein
MSYKEKITEMYNMLSQGKMLDAFDKYYAESVIMEEVGDDQKMGKALNRAREEQFLKSVEDFHGMGVDAITCDEDAGVTMVENWMDASIAGMGRILMKQVAVQKWEGDYIVHEKFYHK